MSVCTEMELGKLSLLFFVFIAFIINTYSVSRTKFSILYDTMVLINLVEFTRTPSLCQLSLYTMLRPLEDIQETVTVVDVTPILLNSLSAEGVPEWTY